jgi:hypothetical protein
MWEKTTSFCTKISYTERLVHVSVSASSNPSPWTKQKLNHCSRDLHLPPNMLFFLSPFSTCRQRIHGRKIHSSLCCKLWFQPSPWPCTLQEASFVENLALLCYRLWLALKSQGARWSLYALSIAIYLPWRSRHLWAATTESRHTSLASKRLSLRSPTVFRNSGVAIIWGYIIYRVHSMELTVSVTFKLWILADRWTPSLSCNIPSVSSLPYRQHGSC